MKRSITLILIIIYTLILQSCCEGHMHKPQIALILLDSETGENLIENEYVDKNTFEIYNLTLNQRTENIIVDDQALLHYDDKSFYISFSTVPDIYNNQKEESFGSQSTRSFLFTFNETDRDTMILNTLIKKEGNCGKYYVTDYANLVYKETKFDLNVDGLIIFGYIKIDTNDL